MKLNLNATRENGDSDVIDEPQTNFVTAPACASRDFRRLKPGEVVVRGDFVANEHRRLEPWEGPGGFRAGAFVKPIYRRKARRTSAAKKTK